MRFGCSKSLAKSNMGKSVQYTQQNTNKNDLGKPGVSECLDIRIICIYGMSGYMGCLNVRHVWM